MLLTKRSFAAAIVATLTLSALPVLAGADDYRFEPVGKPAKSGDVTLIRVRLVQKADGKPVTGAILVQPRLEMGVGAGAMTAPVRPAAAEPGLYAFEVQPSMDGDWVLTFDAKVPGEAATVRGRIMLDLAR